MFSSHRSVSCGSVGQAKKKMHMQQFVNGHRQGPQAGPTGSDGEENDHSFVPSFLRLFLKPQVTQA